MATPRRTTILIVLLTVALIASNAWWAYAALDDGVSDGYREVVLHDNQIALAQSLAVFSELSNRSATRASIIGAAQRVSGDRSPFEKDGFVWVGSIGLRFDPEGRLVEVARAWSPP